MASPFKDRNTSLRERGSVFVLMQHIPLAVPTVIDRRAVISDNSLLRLTDNIAHTVRHPLTHTHTH